jgi:hypothetical protein
MWVRASRRAAIARSGRARVVQVDTPYWRYDLDQAGVVWLPSVCGGPTKNSM